MFIKQKPLFLLILPSTQIQRVNEAKLVFIMKSPFQCFAWSGKNMTWEGYFSVQMSILKSTANIS